MDKNTLTGMLLMGLIFFGFMYCNQPDQTVNQTQTETSGSNNEPAKDAAVSFADTLASSEYGQLSGVVRSLGSLNETDGSYTYAGDGFKLMVDSARTLSGSIAVDGNNVEVAKLLSAPEAGKVNEHISAVKTAKNIINQAGKYKGFARHIGGQDSTVVLENEKMKVSISSRGAMVSSVVLKDYMTELGEKPSQIELFQGAEDGYNFTFTTSDQRIETRDLNFTPTQVSDSTVVMSLDLGNGAYWNLRYTLGDEYLLSMEIEQNKVETALPKSTSSIAFNWHQTMARNEKGKTFEERNSAIYYKYVGESPDDLNAMGDDAEKLNGKVKWVAFKNQFFSSVIIARQSFDNVDLESKEIKSEKYLKDMSASATLPYNVGDGVVAGFDFYFGPNDYPLLSDLDDKIATEEDLELTRLIPLGWGLFRWINTWVIIPVFNFLSGFDMNMGIVILLLTIFIKLVIFPFTFKSFKSQARMRVLQPEMKEINEKYPGQENAMRRQQETMALYSRTGASPFSGCLPMLLQMPILIAMFSFFPSSIELRGESFLWAHDLSAPDFIVTLPFSIPFYGNGVSLFCLMMTIVNVVYMHINMQNQPGGNSMPGMKLMTYMMPVMFLFIFNDYASGLSYYYFLSLLITIVQTWVFRRCIDEQKVRAELLANAKNPKKKKGFMARLEEAQRQQQAALRQQQNAKNKRR